MAEPGTIAVEATDAKYVALKHQPGGIPLDADGKGIWPADQFTFRLIGEGALRERPAAAAPESAPSADAVSDTPAKPCKP
jgi:hypothetical protein